MRTRNGLRKRRTKPVTIKKVASRANVSVATVSRVINNNGAVKAHLREAVESAIQELQYAYKPAPLNGRKDGPHRIGLAVPSILNPFHALLVKGIASAALLHHAELVLLDAGDDQETERQQLARVEDGHLHGMIYIPFTGPDRSGRHPPGGDGLPAGLPGPGARSRGRLHGRLRQRGGRLPGRDVPAQPGAQGHRLHRRTAALQHVGDAVRRVLQGAEGVGLPVRDDLVLPGDTTFETAHAEMQKFLRSERRCSAVFASNDLMALGAWQAAEEAGLRVPDDLSIIGYDELPFSAYRALTTIAQPSFEMGRNALTLLVDLIEGRCTPPQRHRCSGTA